MLRYPADADSGLSTEGAELPITSERVTILVKEGQDPTGEGEGRPQAPLRSTQPPLFKTETVFHIGYCQTCGRPMYGKGWGEGDDMLFCGNYCQSGWMALVRHIIQLSSRWPGFRLQPPDVDAALRLLWLSLDVRDSTRGT